MIENQLSNLYFKNDDHWCLLPEWSHFFIKVGSAISEAKNREHRNIIGLSVPSKAYCASLISLGVIIEKETKKIGCADSRIGSMLTGTVVTYIEKGKLRKGTFDGFEVIDGKQRIRIKILKKKSNGITMCTWVVLPSEQVKIAYDQEVNLSRKQGGSNVAPNNKFACQLLSVSSLDTFLMNAQCEIAIMGSLTALRHEVMLTHFAAKAENEDFVEGNLQEILRVRNFMSNPEHPFKSEVVKVAGNEQPRFLDVMPDTIIFNGAASLLKWRDFCRNANWIVILDRTETKYRDGVDMLNGDYVQNRTKEELLPGLSVCPPGVDMMIFQESLR